MRYTSALPLKDGQPQRYKINGDNMHQTGSVYKLGQIEDLETKMGMPILQLFERVNDILQADVVYIYDEYTEDVIEAVLVDGDSVYCEDYRLENLCFKLEEKSGDVIYETFSPRDVYLTEDDAWQNCHR